MKFAALAPPSPESIESRERAQASTKSCNELRVPPASEISAPTDFGIPTDLARLCGDADRFTQKLIRHADVGMTMKICGDAVIHDSLKQAGKVALLALNGR